DPGAQERIAVAVDGLAGLRRSRGESGGPAPERDGRVDLARRTRVHSHQREVVVRADVRPLFVDTSHRQPGRVHEPPGADYGARAGQAGAFVERHLGAERIRLGLAPTGVCGASPPGAVRGVTDVYASAPRENEVRSALR